eukprot:COSAG01_NODE_22474_length_854_cov_1.286093_1_plen_229_part_10
MTMPSIRQSLGALLLAAALGAVPDAAASTRSLKPSQVKLSRSEARAMFQRGAERRDAQRLGARASGGDHGGAAANGAAREPYRGMGELRARVQARQQQQQAAAVGDVGDDSAAAARRAQLASRAAELLSAEKGAAAEAPRAPPPRATSDGGGTAAGEALPRLQDIPPHNISALLREAKTAGDGDPTDEMAEGEDPSLRTLVGRAAVLQRAAVHFKQGNAFGALVCVFVC